MPKFGNKSKAILATAHIDLQILFEKVVEEYDCSIISGHRGEEEQNQLFADEKSQLKYPESCHNKQPSLAVDAIPYPDIDWNDIPRFKEFVSFVKGVALGLGIRIECGGDWVSFKDYPHFQLKLEA